MIEFCEFIEPIEKIKKEYKENNCIAISLNIFGRESIAITWVFMLSAYMKRERKKTENALSSYTHHTTLSHIP